MSKHILFRNIDEFRNDVKHISFQSLKGILDGLFCFIKENYEKLPNEQIYDLERKQSIIWRELQKRGKLTEATNTEFMKWLYSKHNKRVF